MKLKKMQSCQFLPLIRESMVRSHARAIENAILAGDDADGAFGTSGAAFEGLIHLAAQMIQTSHNHQQLHLQLIN